MFRYVLHTEIRFRFILTFNVIFIYIYFFKGKRFAELEIKLVLSELLSKFEIVPCEKTENPVKLQNRFGTPILPLNGVWLKLNPIEN